MVTNEPVIEDIKAGWLDKEWITEEFLDTGENDYDRLLDYIITQWESGGRQQHPTVLPFTEHGIEHCRTVERNVQRVVRSYEIILDKKEKFILSAASYLHDISLCSGMQDWPEDSFKLYDNHHLESAGWLMREFGKTTLIEPYASIISVIIRFHRRKEDLDECPMRSVLDDDFVRPRLLSAIFRLADALHVDSSRVGERDWLYMLYRANIPLDTKFHWIKSFLVPAIALNVKEKTIDVQLNIPEAILLDDETPEVMRERVDLLGDSISGDLQEEVDCVNQVLSKYSKFVLTEVRYSVILIPDSRQERVEELRRFLLDYSTIYSPTASRVIETALTNIIQSTELFVREGYRARCNYSEIIKQLMTSTTNFLEEFLEIRSCHLGLKNMWAVVQSAGERIVKQIRHDNRRAFEAIGIIHDISSELLDRRRAVRAKIEQSFEKLIEDTLAKKGEPELRLMLFGHSSLAIGCLKKLETSVKELTHLYVCECRGKTKYGPGNQLSYADALSYAMNLRQSGFSGIKIVPDIAVAKFLSGVYGDIDFFIVGTNGIGLDGKCAHTIGHLAITKLVNAYQDPKLMLISDTFKIGELVPNPEATREGWYTSDPTLLKKLQRNSIHLHCPREDVMDLEEVDVLLTERGVVRPKQEGADTTTALLNEWYKTVMDEVDDLVNRKLAALYSTLSH